jgi:uncharacterized protein YgbK (DUF1537 family)
VPLRVVRDGAIAERLDELRREGVSYAVADAIDDDDLRALGAAAADLPLVVGGAGLALGFHGEGTPAAVPEPDGPAVVLAGSCSTATQEQVRRMAARHTAIKVGADTSPGDVAADLRNGPVLVYSTAPPEELQLGAGDRIEALFGELARRFVAEGARRVVVAGGETSGAVVQALGVRALAVGREIAPGVPWMTSLGDPPLALALKSGNFGGPDFFLEALDGRG